MLRPSRRARVLIAGGGIGGLAAAIALGQRGIDSTVLERSRFADESGAGIQLGPNATRVLRTINALPAIEPYAFRPEALVIYDGLTGVTLATMPLGRAVIERHGAPYLTLHRADLHAGLLASAGGLDSVELRDGFEVTEVSPLSGGVAARSRDGMETDGSCLLGADGLWSEMRKLVAPQASLRFAGATAWRALLPRSGLPFPFAAGNVGLWLGPGSHLVHYPVRGGDALNIVAVTQGGAAQEGWNIEADPAALIASFGSWAEPARMLLGDVKSWRSWSLYRLSPLRRWAQGRVALLGDAAHPVLPYLAQGAGLAIEDAATLARALEAADGEPGLAFVSYERSRRRRVARVQAQAARLGLLYHLRGPLARARNFLLSRRKPEAILAGFDWLYAGEDTG